MEASYDNKLVQCWPQPEMTLNDFTSNITDIKNGVIICRSMSSLRGKIAIQSEEEIDNQINDLREEWER